MPRWVKQGKRVSKEDKKVPMSSAEENKALVRRFLEAHAKGDLDALEEMLASDFVKNLSRPTERDSKTSSANNPFPCTFFLPSQ